MAEGDAREIMREIQRRADGRRASHERYFRSVMTRLDGLADRRDSESLRNLADAARTQLRELGSLRRRMDERLRAAQARCEAADAQRPPSAAGRLARLAHALRRSWLRLARFWTRRRSNAARLRDYVRLLRRQGDLDVTLVWLAEDVCGSLERTEAVLREWGEALGARTLDLLHEDFVTRDELEAWLEGRLEQWRDEIRAEIASDPRRPRDEEWKP